MRTERAWYRWAYGRGRGSGALAFDEGSTVVEAETAWRFDNRICNLARPGARKPVVEARVRGLDLALRDGEGLLDPAVSLNRSARPAQVPFAPFEPPIPPREQLLTRLS